MSKTKRIILTAIFLIIFKSTAFAGDMIDMGKIIAIESSGNPGAYNAKSKARGLCQVTEICLKEWNNYHPKEKYLAGDLFRSETNLRIAGWYLETRIPQMLRHYEIAVTVENVLIAYNAGISYLVKGLTLPKETAGYIRKYNEGR